MSYVQCVRTAAVLYTGTGIPGMYEDRQYRTLFCVRASAVHARAQRRRIICPAPMDILYYLPTTYIHVRWQLDHIEHTHTMIYYVCVTVRYRILQHAAIFRLFYIYNNVYDMYSVGISYNRPRSNIPIPYLVKMEGSLHFRTSYFLVVRRPSWTFLCRYERTFSLTHAVLQLAGICYFRFLYLESCISCSQSAGFVSRLRTVIGQLATTWGSPIL